MTFSLHEGGVKSDYTCTIIQQTHPLVHILGTSSLISEVASFVQFIPSTSCMASYPSPDEPPEHRGWYKITVEPSKNGHILLII